MAMTAGSNQVTTTADDKFSVGNNGPQDPFRDFAVFNNTTVQHPNRRNHLIVVSGDLIQKHNEYSNAFAIIHEFVAHIYLRSYLRSVDFYSPYRGSSIEAIEHYYFGSPAAPWFNNEYNDYNMFPNMFSPGMWLTEELWQMKNGQPKTYQMNDMFELMKSTTNDIDSDNQGSGKPNNNWPSPPSRSRQNDTKGNSGKNKSVPKYNY
jgi:hypothetical protein